ncbi:MAG TPA: PAS domain-containing sensor histidine kinase [Rhizomicrobium sp.]|jgi:cell cycle sensor histidine kinase DivJ|nr:PAS domain-containing sensor histidine kinase [Rhizomicrobium sp.]
MQAPNDKSVPSRARGNAGTVARDLVHARRRFAIVQVAKAALGAILWLTFVALVGKPDLMETFALAGFLAPCVLALLAILGISLDILESASLACFAGLIGYMAGITGGMHSPLIVWFALVPAEAALAGGRVAVLRAAVSAGLALCVVAVIESLHGLPPSRLVAPAWQIYAGSVLAAIVQSAVIAIAAQDRRLASDLAAAEGAAMYRFLADNATDLITRHGSDGRIRFASPAATRLLAVAPESLEGVAPASLVHPDDLKIMQAAFVEASYFGRAATAEVRFRRQDGSVVWTEMRCRPARAMNGKIADIVAVTRDISERKVNERALIAARDMAEQASRAKSRFLANMSHELRTPLNAIIGFSEVMTHEMFGALGTPRYLEYARLIHESGGHLLELINGILDMSKIEAGKFDLSEEIFDLEDAVQQALRFLRLQSERKGVALTMALAPEARMIFGDRRAVKQILVNLLANGVKFTPRGGEVSIVTLRDGGAIEIRVADSGVGIAEADLRRLGQPFEQGAGSHVGVQEGTGLGLALVKALCAMHGGEAVIHSVLGEGTVVRVRLPHAAVSDSDCARHLQETREPLKGAA